MLRVRFPYNPLHLLCMQQLHAFSHKYELELKECMKNVWDCTGILQHQIKYSKKHITTACTHAHLLYNRNCIGTARSTKLNYTGCSPITTKISCTKTQRSSSYLKFVIVQLKKIRSTYIFVDIYART